jgi:hypothetical protein
MRNLVVRNYLMWMSNFGVVPFLTFANFLFLPCFLSLLFLWPLVLLVFDPILLTPLTSIIFNYFKNIYVYFVSHIVKIFLIFTLFAHVQPLVAKVYFMAKGEQKSIYFSKLSRFSIGNKEVITHKFIKEKDTLRVKGKSIGYSDLIMWSKDGSKTKYEFYILSKGQYLKTVQWAEFLNGINLNAHIKGNMLYISGVINELETYQALQRSLKKIGHENIHLKVTLTKDLRNQIIALIYKDFIKLGDLQIKCSLSSINFRCFHSSDSQLTKFYRKQYFVNFIKVNSLNNSKNLKVSINIYQVEYLSKYHLETGLNKLQGQMSSIISNKMNGLLSSNIIHLENIEAKITTVASPEAMIRLGKKLSLSLGGEKQFSKSIGQLAQSFEWKFSGLKIQLKVDKIGHRYLLEYKNEFSTPVDQGINGSKESGSFFIGLDSPQQLFKIGISSKGKRKSSFPALSKIPLLGHLFKASSEQQRYQEIYGHIQIKEL